MPFFFFFFGGGRGGRCESLEHYSNNTLPYLLSLLSRVLTCEYLSRIDISIICRQKKKTSFEGNE